MNLEMKGNINQPDSKFREWQISKRYLQSSNLKQYAKKHGPELQSCLVNLEWVRMTLNESKAKQATQLGKKFTPEKKGVWRICQTQPPSGHETRLYVYVDNGAHLLYPISVGDKQGQQSDIEGVCRLVASVSKKK